MIRQKELLSHLCREGTMLWDSSWGSVSTSTRLGDEDPTVACPWALLSVKRYLKPCQMTSLLKPFVFLQQWPLLMSLEHWSLFPMVGPPPCWISLLPVRATTEQSMRLISHTLPLGLENLWGLVVPFRTELRCHGSKSGKLLEQAIYMQYPQTFLEQYRAKNKSRLP